MKIMKNATSDRIVELVDNLTELQAVKEKGLSSIELSQIRWVFPILLLPLVVQANVAKISINCTERNDNVRGYLGSVCFPNGTNELSRLEKDYLPIAQLSCNNKNEVLNNYEERILSKMTVENRKPFLNSLKYLTSELESNVREHSRVNNYWIFSQYWKRTRTCEIALCDTGIGYKKSYEGTEYEVKQHAHAIINAFLGKSSKSSSERGTGLPSIARVFVEGYEGEMVVMSGDSLLHKYENENDIYVFDAFWAGAFVGLRFKLKELDIYSYL
jgi:hypothetical protein